MDRFLRWIGWDGKANKLRLRNVGPVPEPDSEPGPADDDTPYIVYRNGWLAYFASDDWLFPEGEPQRSITELEPEGSLDEQLDQHLRWRS